MSKTDETHINKETNIPIDSSDTSKIIPMRQYVSQSLVENNNKNILQFVSVTKRILHATFWMYCDINPERHGEAKEKEGNYIFHITKKNIKKEAEWQVRITITKDCLFIIQLNPYDHYGEYYFQGTWLDNKELIAEFDNFMSFINRGEFAEHGKFKKEINYDPNSIDDWSAGYDEDPKHTNTPLKKV